MDDSQLPSSDSTLNEANQTSSRLIYRWAEKMKEKNWSHTIDTNHSRECIIFFQTDAVSSRRCHLIFNEKTQQVILIVFYERRCPKEYIKTMSEFFNHINYALPLGFFSLDTDDGEIRFKHALDVTTLKSTLFIHCLLSFLTSFPEIFSFFLYKYLLPYFFPVFYIQNN